MGSSGDWISDCETLDDFVIHGVPKDADAI